MMAGRDCILKRQCITHGGDGRNGHVVSFGGGQGSSGAP